MEMHIPLVLFSFFLSVSSGIFFAQGLVTFRGLSSKKYQMVTVVAALVSMVVGGIAVFTHLQHWERIFNGFGHLSSPITIELIGVVVFVVVLAAFFLIFFRTEDGISPRWSGWLGMIMGVLLMVIVGESYILASTPVWNSNLWIVFLACTCVAIAGPVMIIQGYFVKENTEQIVALGKKLSLIGILLLIVSVFACAIYMSTLGDFGELGYYFDPTLPDIAMADTAAATNVFTGDQAVVFWIAVVACGLVLPLVCIILMMKQKKLKTVMILAIVALAGICCCAISFRIIFFLTAVHIFAVF